MELSSRYQKIVLTVLVILSLSACGSTTDLSDDSSFQNEAGGLEASESSPTSDIQETDATLVNCQTLRENAVNVLETNTTVCPGTYQNTILMIQDVDGIEIQGQGVVLKGRHSVPASQRRTGVINLSNVENVRLSGFEIQYRGPNITLSNSHHNTLEHLVLSDIGCGEGIIFDYSTRNSLRDSKLVGSFAPISLLTGSHQNHVEDSQFVNPTAPQGCDIFRPGLYIFSDQNQFKNNQLTGVSFAVIKYSQENLIQRNTIQKSTVGIILSGANNTVKNNTIQQNEWGIWLKSSKNEITGNDLSLNTEGCWLEDPGLFGNTLFDNTCDW